MKIPSIFRTPRYQRFNITPRYYDPIKEEIEQRTSRIRRELALQNGEQTPEESGSDGSRIAGSFRAGKHIRKGGSAALMQLVIVLLLVALAGGYIYLGNTAIYVFLIVSSVLLYLKIKRII